MPPGGWGGAGIHSHGGEGGFTAVADDSAAAAATAQGPPAAEDLQAKVEVVPTEGDDDGELFNVVPEVLLEPPERRYSGVQFLGFNLFTAPGTAADGCFGESGEELEECYLGDEHASEDIQRRSEIMMEAIKRAYASPHWHRSQDTLKVFVAPEFYWRGAHGAYRLKRREKSALRSLIANMSSHLEDPRYRDWLFIMGTFVAAQPVDTRWVNESGMPFDNVSYFNFAPIRVGGSKESYVHFKHFISGIDFLQAQPAAPRAQPEKPPPGLSSVFCREHPHSNGCVYGRASRALLEDYGFVRHQVLHHHGLIDIGGLRLGLEICLDHAVGELCRHRSPERAVDVQVIVSAGMNIPSGPVCTVPGGPVFLSDGFARTELSFNALGTGDRAVKMPDNSKRYAVGMVYGADALVGLQQWIADTIDSYTGYGFGSRFPGEGTLPGGSSATGETGVKFVQISALGDDWLEQVSGFYTVQNYLEAQKLDHTLEKAVKRFLAKYNETENSAVEEAALFPTVDIYGPMPIAPRWRRWDRYDS